MPWDVWVRARWDKGVGTAMAARGERPRFADLSLVSYPGAGPARRHRASVGRPDVLLLDEPLTGLDVAAVLSFGVA